MANGYVSVLGTGLPRLACLRPTAWLHQWPGTAQLRQQLLKTLTSGQACEADDTKTSLGATSLGWLPRSGDIYAGGTSRGSHDMSRDDQGQAGANGRSVPVSSLVLRRQAHALGPEASSKGSHIGATRTRPAGRQDGGHRGAHNNVTIRAFVGEDYFCQDNLY